MLFEHQHGDTVVLAVDKPADVLGDDLRGVERMQWRQWLRTGQDAVQDGDDLQSQHLNLPVRGGHHHRDAGVSGQPRTAYVPGDDLRGVERMQWHDALWTGGDAVEVRDELHPQRSDMPVRSEQQHPDTGVHDRSSSLVGDLQWHVREHKQ
ncbi:hypothetical protein D7X32_40810 [Corallococcus carmarthensis]|uniref:Uncharacterized protein n=1 Tax=Corallococcus carmarthensis TaxID=2316728 RepID=A0A3A8JIU3_9BACT|nr:hypothetical protein D7X32_40810 [Corallococcus carmarthensis]